VARRGLSFVYAAEVCSPGVTVSILLILSPVSGGLGWVKEGWTDALWEQTNNRRTTGDGQFTSAIVGGCSWRILIRAGCLKLMCSRRWSLTRSTFVTFSQLSRVSWTAGLGRMRLISLLSPQNQSKRARSSISYRAAHAVMGRSCGAGI
jgi:hypothetical protein